MARVLKWDIPVDGGWHEIGGGACVLVATRRHAGEVQVWTVEGGGPTTTACVFGTGEPLPSDANFHVGSCLAEPGLVWHVFRR